MSKEEFEAFDSDTKAAFTQLSAEKMMASWSRPP